MKNLLVVVEIPHDVFVEIEFVEFNRKTGIEGTIVEEEPKRSKTNPLIHEFVVSLCY